MAAAVMAIHQVAQQIGVVAFRRLVMARPFPAHLLTPVEQLARDQRLVLARKPLPADCCDA